MRAFGMSRVLGFYAVMTVIALVIQWSRGDVATQWALTGSLVSWATSLGAGLGLGLALVVASRFAVAQFAWGRTLADELRSILGELGRGDALAIACLSAIGEETLFRGVLQPAVGLVVASAIFGLLHVGPTRRFLPWTLMAVGAGLCFGLLFERSGSLVAPVVAHATVNYLNIRYLSLADGPRRGLASRLADAQMSSSLLF